MQDLNDMLYFAEVVKEGGFAAAGRALGLPKSRLSRRIARLEGQLGVRLLQRTTRKLSLTTAGELYYRHCAAMCDEAEAAAAAVAHVQSEPRGIVRVVCPVTVAQTVLGPSCRTIWRSFRRSRFTCRSAIAWSIWSKKAWTSPCACARRSPTAAAPSSSTWA